MRKISLMEMMVLVYGEVVVEVMLVPGQVMEVVEVMEVLEVMEVREVREVVEVVATMFT